MGSAGILPALVRYVAGQLSLDAKREFIVSCVNTHSQFAAECRELRATCPRSPNPIRRLPPPVRRGGLPILGERVAADD
jgi:hypothetical protein